MSQGDARLKLDELLVSGAIDDATHRQLCAALASSASADVSGSGAAAQGDGAQAAGEQAQVVGPNNQAPVTQINYQVPHGPAGTSREALRCAYLHRVWQQTDPLALPAGGNIPRLRLGAVYTALMTEQRDVTAAAGKALPEGSTMHGERGQPLSAVAMLDQERHLVLLGGPGSGKSTFVSFVAQAMAGEGLGALAPAPAPRLDDLTAAPPADEEVNPFGRRRGVDDDAAPRQPWRHGPLLPVRVVLRDLVAQLPSADRDVSADNVWQYLCSQLEAATLGEFAPVLRTELLEDGGLVMFDGLDEVPEALSRRAQIQHIVTDFARTFGRCRILVTSRTYAYRRQEWKLPGFTEAQLAPFSMGQISAFVRAWYDHMVPVPLTRADAEGRAALLVQQVARQHRIRDLAEQPLLLTLLARLQTEGGGADLPSNREDLYFRAVQLMLNDWEAAKIRRQADGSPADIEPSLSEWLKAGQDDIRRELNRMAFEAQRDQQELHGTADIRQADLVHALLRASTHPDVQVRQLERYLRDRAGLLLEHGVGMLQFPHRTFQEYLAACHLANDDFPEQLAALARADPLRWREVTLLAAAHAARGNRGLPTWALVEALCPVPMVGDTVAAAPDAWGALLAGEVLVASGEHARPAPRNRGKLERMRTWQMALLTGDRCDLPVAERALAGRQLASLGDPRPEVTTLDAMHFCVVPAGPFMMGEGETSSDQGPLHRVEMPCAYAIGRWPVSQAQWREFVEATGYESPDADAVLGTDNHPATAISWAEALRFCDFLTARWRPILPAGWVVTLPSEGEWEKAARGGEQAPQQALPIRVDGLAQALASPGPLMQNPAPDRDYPWGQGKEGRPVNWDMVIGQASALGLGASCPSPCGCEEMAGNVWEWTRSVWGRAFGSPDFGYPFDPSDATRETLHADEQRWLVVRGGAWDNSADYARCAIRLRLLPVIRYGILGFRVVLRSPPVA